MCDHKMHKRIELCVLDFLRSDSAVMTLLRIFVQNGLVHSISFDTHWDSVSQPLFKAVRLLFERTNCVYVNLFHTSEVECNLVQYRTMARPPHSTIGV